MKFHGVYKLNQSPCILALWGDDALDKVYRSHQGEPLYFFWHNAWYSGRVKSMLKIKYNFLKLKSKGIKPFQMTNSLKEDRLRKQFGIKGFMCMPYIFTNEKKYQLPKENFNIHYDAIYTAQLAPFKRLELTSNIEKLYILTYKRGGIKSWNLHEEYPSLNHAEYNPSWIDTDEKSRKLHQSAVGLCLSEEEGPMLASLEYMLSGLPVVSTESRGGRDGYYDDEYCMIVQDNPKAVAEGVKELLNRNLDSKTIQEKTIAKLNHHRERYTDYICELLKQEEGVNLNPDELYHQLFTAPENNFVSLDDYNG